MMTTQEKILYHQIHPLKVLFFWKRALLLAVLVSVVPPLVISGILVRFTSLEKYAESRSGRFVKRHMTRARELLRLAGYVVMAFGAWNHQPWPILLGFLVILLAWFAVRSY